MTILVTGGAGFIGSHTIVELHNAGFDVVTIDDLSNSTKAVYDQVEKITGKSAPLELVDLRDAKAIDGVFKKYKIDGVIHFAASKAVGESVEKPLLYYQNNLGSLVNLLGVMADNNVNNFIFSSSCTVYGQPDVLPVSEQTPVQPAMSPYGNTKQVGEEIIKDFGVAEKGFKSISLRYFNPVGAHESGLIGELPLGPPQNLMPVITQAGIGKREGLKVFGSDYDTVDGTCVRDYIHVTDLAVAHVTAVKRLIENKGKANYEVFNIGTGNGFSVLEVIKSFEKNSGVKLNYEIVDRRPGDIEKIWADTTFANEELGWKASLSLDEMTSSAWKWEQFVAENAESILA